MVQTFKNSMLAMAGKEDNNGKIYIMEYRKALHNTAGFAPS